MSSRYPKALVVGCALATLTACSGEQPKQDALPAVPEISNTLNVRATPPCQLLSEAQLGKLGFAEGTPGRTELGAQCVWHTERATLALTRYVGGGGLAALAADSDPAASRVRIEGYPALETFTEGGDYCRYDVGVAERQALVATMKGGQPSSCAALQQVLSYALANLAQP